MKRQVLSPEAQAAWETPLPSEEFERRLAAALAEKEEIERLSDLIRWFMKRYPTGEERLAYVRRKYAEWTRAPESIQPAPVETAPRDGNK